MYALVCLSILGCAFAAPHHWSQYPPSPQHWDQHPPPPQHWEQHTLPPQNWGQPSPPTQQWVQPSPPPQHWDQPSPPPQHWGQQPPPPQHWGPHHHNHDHHHHDDSSKFMDQLNTKMARFDQMMQEFLKYFPKNESSSGIQGNQYKINIVLNEFTEKEITVKARDGLVIVQAVHKYEDGNERHYMDVRSMPAIVKADSGSWTFDRGVLKIMFPLKDYSITTEYEASETTELTEVTTQEAVDNQDREEIESHEHDNTDLDADVGVRNDSDVEIMTNEIPHTKLVKHVENTTYAVEFKKDLEFVPVQVKQVPQ